MKLKGINKIYYKLWKHFGKKIGRIPVPSLEKTIFDEIIMLRKYLVLRDICPEIIHAIAPKIPFPDNEIAEGEFLKYFRYLDKSKSPSAYEFLWHWLPDVAVDVNSAAAVYQSDFSLAEYKKNIDRYAGEDIPACIKNNIGYLWKMLFSGDPLEDGERFCSTIIHSKNFENYPPIGYVLLCNFFLYKNQFEGAQKAFDMYVKKTGGGGLEGWWAVADFAYKNGRKEYAQQSAVFNEIIRTTKENLFSQKINGRSVALIGNGPQEIGQNKKEEIDAHDVVIRMNAYELTPSYVKDYGEKCNIWYQYTGLADSEWEREKGHPDFYFIGNSPYSIDYPKHFIERYTHALNKGIKIQTVELSDLAQIYKRTKIHSISGGLLMIYLVKKANSRFFADDCFGFSFKENKEELPWLHVDGGGEFMPFHSLEMERLVIWDILSRERL